MGRGARTLNDCALFQAGGAEFQKMARKGWREKIGAESVVQKRWSEKGGAKRVAGKGKHDKEGAKRIVQKGTRDVCAGNGT